MYATGTVNVTNATIANNSTTKDTSNNGGGGAVFENEGTLAVHDSRIVGNTATTGGVIADRDTTGGGPPTWRTTGSGPTPP